MACTVMQALQETDEQAVTALICLPPLQLHVRQAASARLLSLANLEFPSIRTDQINVTHDGDIPANLKAVKWEPIFQKNQHTQKEPLYV